MTSTSEGWPLQKTGWDVAPFANRIKAYKSTHYISRSLNPILLMVLKEKNGP